MALNNGKGKTRDPTLGGFSGKAAGLAKGFSALAGKYAVLLRGKASGFPGLRILDRLSGKKRKPRLAAPAGAAVLFTAVLISALIAVSNRAASSRPGNGSAAVPAGPDIPMEDLFIPDEPDFLPEFLLEREPRSSWSVEDIRPYWESLEGNRELWQGEIQSAVDKLMEAVP